VTMAAALATGGALAGSQLAAGSSSGSAAGAAGSSASSASSASSGAGAGAGAGAAVSAAVSAVGNTSGTGARHLGAIARLRRLGGMYGQFSVRTKAGATRTVAFERGVVSSAGTDLVVRAANGATWTWRFTSATVVRKGGAKVSRTALSSGEHVIVAGPLAAGARDARLIVVRSTKATTSGTTTN
jgi:hypothetical protein